MKANMRSFLLLLCVRALGAAHAQGYTTLLTAFSNQNITGPYIQTGAPGTAFLNAYAANPTIYTATAITKYVQGAYRLSPTSNNTVLSAMQQLLSNQTIPLYAMDNATAPVPTLSTSAIASEGINFRIVLAKTADQPRGFVPADDTKLLVGGVVITCLSNYTTPASLAVAPGKVAFYGLFMVKNLLANGTRKGYPIQNQADQSLIRGKTFLTVQSDAFGAGNFECASTHLENGVWYIAGMFWFK